MNYTHLTRDERYQIEGLRKAGLNGRRIACILQRDPSTIYRELARNGVAGSYCPRQADCLARERAKACANGPRVDPQLWHWAREALIEGWSPEEISGRLKIENHRLSHETIYRRVYAEKRNGGRLWRHLRCQKPHRKRYGRYDRRGRTRPVGATPIELRPAIVATRSTFGHWEGDTMLDSRMRSALVTLAERKSRYTLLAKVERKTASLVTRAVTRLLAPFKPLAKTLTVDNGKEFSDHQAISKALQIDCYFARPYASWQRGTIENTNGLLRQYFPRSRSISTIRTSEIQRAMDKLNHRPRKCLRFRTPHEVFTEALQAVALQG